MKLLTFSVVCCLASTLVAQKSIITKDTDSLKITITLLSSQVNSNFDDYSPSINAEGNELYFTSRRPFTPKEIQKGSQGKENVYKSVLNEESNAWTEAIALPLEINVPGRFNSNITLSNDGQRLLLYRDDQYGNGDIYESFLQGETWSVPVSISSVINTDAHESTASISPDGRTVYFVSDRKGGFGKRDIWQSTQYENGSWSNPKNLGDAINTEFDEESVFMHPDGKTLYFSSRGHNTMGGYDIFKSVYENDEWSTPINLGEPINTKEDDLFFVLTADGKMGYYSSARGGNKDIYSIEFQYKQKKQPKLKVIKGVIRDAKTQASLEAKIEIIDNEKNVILGTFSSNSESGKYLFTLPSGKNYGITVSAPNYLFYSDNVTSTDTARYEQIIKNVELQKLEKGTKIVLRNIFFDYDKATLKKESEAELQKLLKLMEQNPNLVIELSGHTDTQGAAAYNQQLSENRAHAVVDYLLAKGITSNRLIFKGYGKTTPLISDEEIAKMKTQKEKEAAHAQNRRTEIKIVSM
jgi:outer membrane protein OmpA-like peptidoglycan-associated protein